MPAQTSSSFLVPGSVGRAPSPLATAVRFAGELRSAGLIVGVDQVEAFLRAFEWLDVARAADVRHAARATLLTRRADAALFERVFDRFWLNVQGSEAPGQKMPLAPRHRRFVQQPALASLLAQRARSTDPEIDVPDRSRCQSDDEVLRRKDFSKLSEAELDAMRRLLERRAWDFASRVTRRWTPARRGARLDLRRAISLSARSGGALLTLPRRRQQIKPRPLVLLADVSGSMELYTRVLLQFFHALAQQLKSLESFVFATRLTCITGALRLRDVDAALGQVSGSVVDFASGTRIGECLRHFNARHAARVLGRGAVVVVVSDGWERGDPEQLAVEVRALRDRCYRLIWLNPLLGRARYEPRTRGMAAALAYVDDFLSCHDVQSIEALSAHLAALPRRRAAGSGAAATMASPGGQRRRCRE